jgi:CHAP domain
MIVFLIFFYFLIFLYVPIYTPYYGDVLGYSEGVVVFSNYKGKRHERSYAGEKWECVEFVRRFLMNTRGITFDEIDHAYDIFNLNSFQTLDGIKIPIDKNTDKPKKGDILVWEKDISDMEHGHVAIVVDSKDNGDLFIAEQNWENKDWEDRNYSRIIRQDTEPHLIGWIKIKAIL